MIPPVPPTPESEEREAAAREGFGRLGWWEYDFRTGEVWWDDRVREIIGLPDAAPFTIEEARSVIHPDDRHLAEAVVAEVLEPDAPNHYTVQQRIVRGDSFLWVRIIGHVQWRSEPDRRPLRLIGIMEDITDRSDPGGRFRSAISGSDIILAHFDRDLRYTWIHNPDAHFDEGAVVGRRDDELAPAEWVAELTSLKREILERDAEIGRVVQVVVDDEPRHYSVHGRPLHGPDGSVTGGATASADVTAQIRAELLARESSEAKSQFMSMISHELKTPLAGILGFADLLEEGIPDAIPESALDHVRRIKVTVAQMRALVDGLLTYSRIQAGHEELSLGSAEPAELAAEALTVAEGLVLHEAVRLERDVPPDLPTLTTDRRKLVRILVNLLGNAIKYTERGTVELATEARGDMCLFHVSDTGVGIEPDHLQQIFEPFWRGPRRPGTEPGGTGLGLPIARETARLLGGELTVESSPGSGSRFTLRVPIGGPGPRAGGEGPGETRSGHVA